MSAGEGSSGRVEDEHLGTWLQWHTDRTPDLRERLICAYLPHTRMLAAKAYAARTHDEVPFSDYYQLATVGLIESVDGFNPTLGVPFTAYCVKRIRGAILNGLPAQTEKTQQIGIQQRLREERLREIKSVAESGSHESEAVNLAASQSRTDHSPDELFHYLSEVGIGIALGILLEDTAMIDHEAFGIDAFVDSPAAAYFRKNALNELREAIRHATVQLPRSQRIVIEFHYLQAIPFVDIARTMGLTKGRVSQLHRLALEQLRKSLHAPLHFDLSL